MKTTSLQFIILLWVSMVAVGMFANVSTYVNDSILDGNTNMSFSNAELASAMYNNTAYEDVSSLNDVSGFNSGNLDFTGNNTGTEKPLQIFDRLDWLLNYGIIIKSIGLVTGLTGAYATSNIVSNVFANAMGEQNILTILIFNIPTFLLIILTVKIINFWFGRRLKTD